MPGSIGAPDGLEPPPNQNVGVLGSDAKEDTPAVLEKKSAVGRRAGVVAQVWPAEQERLKRIAQQLQ